MRYLFKKKKDFKLLGGIIFPALDSRSHLTNDIKANLIEKFICKLNYVVPDLTVK